ncbi:lipase maturation factor family protein [bacterium]|jgi:hypothetical protein|nr:lipase maturation factor family protein [bacterium]
MGSVKGFGSWLLGLNPNRYLATRFLFLRSFGFIYFIAFLSLSEQVLPLLGSDGLLPAVHYLDRLEDAYGGIWPAFFKKPSLFLWYCSDSMLQGLAWFGTVLSLGVVLGFANSLVLFLLWFLYLSFVHIGQVFYGFGWESIVLETGFLSIFLCRIWKFDLFDPDSPPPTCVMWLLRWELFRIMFGAGLIKLRGDACWPDLTCLFYHFETQPIPNPLSWYFHHMPPEILKGGVAFNHFVELVVPFFFFGPRILRHFAGSLTLLFQLVLILSGNLSWLNWLTAIICLSCFDDRFLCHFLPRKFREMVSYLEPGGLRWLNFRKWPALLLTVLVIWLSQKPVENMFSKRQIMNTAFDSLHLVNTYGAFGSIGKDRFEVILSGTRDRIPRAESEWLEYEFKFKPGRVDRIPGMVAPYHYRLDWQIWFAAMSSYQNNPWLVHLVYKLLRDNQGVLRLLGENPFSGSPPNWIRADLYQYKFTGPGESPRTWWKRSRVKEYLPPLSLQNPPFLRFLKTYGWIGNDIMKP